ncbi:MAG: type II toxin-antitoxin system MqsR family toxin [Proteobacteria bacterium]|nr:type II toxin-antitoxin system MqsR family toxin [Pseudomonadota bacterium]
MKQINVPSYSLEHIQKVFDSPKNLVMTNSAYQGMVALSFNQNDVVNAIQALTRKNFYKSMPPFNLKFAAWQDVYRLNFREIDLYIKFQINDNGELLLSFKGADND